MNISAIPNLSNTYTTTQAVEINQEKLTTESFEDALKAATENGDEKEILKACQDFESYFLTFMFKEMRKTVNLSSPKSNSLQIFEEMLDDEYSKKATGQGGIGLASFMFKQLTRNKGNDILV